MYPQMSLIVAVVFVILATNIANKWPFPSMQAYVTSQMGVLCELFTAELACVRLFPGVELNMGDEIAE